MRCLVTASLAAWPLPRTLRGPVVGGRTWPTYRMDASTGGAARHASSLRLCASGPLAMAFVHHSFQPGEPHFLIPAHASARYAVGRARGAGRGSAGGTSKAVVHAHWLQVTSKHSGGREGQKPHWRRVPSTHHISSPLIGPCHTGILTRQDPHVALAAGRCLGMSCRGRRKACRFVVALLALLQCSQFCAGAPKGKRRGTSQNLLVKPPPPPPSALSK